MSTNDKTHAASNKLKVHGLLSMLVIVIGFVLMILKIDADSEPGAIPLLLIVLGVAWHVITRVRVRSHRKQPH